MTNTTPFARWLREQMERVGATQADVAKGARMPPSSISLYLSVGTIPRRAGIERLATFFGVPVHEALEAAGLQTPGSISIGRPILKRRRAHFNFWRRGRESNPVISTL